MGQATQWPSVGGPIENRGTQLMKDTANVFKIILPLLHSRKQLFHLAVLLLLSFAGTAQAQGTPSCIKGSFGQQQCPGQWQL